MSLFRVCLPIKKNIVEHLVLLLIFVLIPVCYSLSVKSYESNWKLWKYLWLNEMWKRNDVYVFSFSIHTLICVIIVAIWLWLFNLPTTTEILRRKNQEKSGISLHLLNWHSKKSQVEGVQIVLHFFLKISEHKDFLTSSAASALNSPYKQIFPAPYRNVLLCQHCWFLV